MFSPGTKSNRRNIMLEQKEIQEVFISPYGLKEIVKLDSNPLYGSDHLNEKFMKALSKVDKTKGDLIKIQKLLDKKTLIPCFLQKGLLHHISWRIFAPIGIKSIAGFFNPEDGRVVIMISNDANIFTYVSNNFLADLTIHELSHRAAYIDANKFYSTFRNELIDFYKALFCEIFKIKEKDLNDKTVFDIIAFLFRNIEMTATTITSGQLIKYNILIRKSLSSLSSLKHEEFEYVSDDYVKIIALFLNDLNMFFDAREEYSNILNPIYRAYKKALGIRNTTTVCIQELIYPSEVIAILSEYGRPDISSKVLSIN